MKYQRLTPGEREIIGIMLAQNKSLPDIACALGRPTCTVSREIARNTSDGMPYRAFRAQERAEHEARQRRECSKIEDSKALQDFIKEKLRLRWSPKQIEQELKKTYPGNRSMQASHETIYTYLYVQTKGALKKELISYLRQAKKHRQKRSKSKEKRGKITNMTSIDDRPPEIEDRRVPGHWEGDLVMGKFNRSAIGTLVERKTRFLIIVKLTGSDAETVRRAFGREILKLPEHMRLTMTYDQGKEMAKHELFTTDTKMRVYFCDPHSPWQRGTNENTNMLVRGFYPKGTDFTKIGSSLFQVGKSSLNFSAVRRIT